MTRINKYLAANTHLSRRQADEAIKSARVTINSETATLGDVVNENDIVKLDNAPINSELSEKTTLLLNKPVGYVCSRDGQGSPTVYDLLPKIYHHLNIAGRLDKDSSGLVILTSDGDLLYELTHPSKHKEKVYEVTLNKELNNEEFKKLVEGVDIGDKRPSKFQEIQKIGPKKYKIILEEGRNRQIRRSFSSINIKVNNLHRTDIYLYKVDEIMVSNFKLI